MKLLFALCLFALPVPALAQGVVKAPTTPDTTARAAAAAAQKTADDQATLIANLQTLIASKADAASLPKPANTLPNTESTTPSAGAALTYLRSDYVPSRITRAGKVTTDINGNWSITWAKPMPAAPVTLPVPMNTMGAATITCNVVTSTMTGSTGYCTQTRPLPATLTLLTSLVNYVITQVAPTGTVVQVFALPTTD